MTWFLDASVAAHDRTPGPECIPRGMFRQAHTPISMDLGHFKWVSPLIYSVNSCIVRGTASGPYTLHVQCCDKQDCHVRISWGPGDDSGGDRSRRCT